MSHSQSWLLVQQPPLIASDVAALDNVRVEYLGKKGHSTSNDYSCVSCRRKSARSRCGDKRSQRAGATGSERARRWKAPCRMRV